MAHDDNDTSGMVVDMIQTQEIRAKNIILIKEGGVKLVEITSISKSKPGKHGAAKFCFSGLNLVTGKNYQFTEGSKTNLYVCSLVKIPCEFMEINENDGSLVVLNEETAEVLTVALSRISEETIEEIKKHVTLVGASGSIRFKLVDTPYLVVITDITSKAE
ncbi:translation initiation factor 5A [Nematocida minor]|uniref:translation initiation factor 5A n=1 Tax=Nematocida minor TaxID=1912983 RepID=UPI00221F9993|nr:translation initiation factor 5A [Nematocida minor]KAI5192889.1 translation initiation factor 5A [Nematocida minor]